MENQLKIRKVKSLHSLVQVGAATGMIKAMELVLNPVGKDKKLPFLQETCYRCGKSRHQKYRIVKLWTQCVEVVERKDTLRRSVSKLNNSTHSLEVPQASTSTAGAGASKPLYFDDDGQPVYTYMVSVPHINKHFDQVPQSIGPYELRGRNEMENSTGSTGHTKCSTMLLKADTGG